MIVVEQDRAHVTYLWPPEHGSVYKIPVEHFFSIGDGFLWTVGNEQYQMVVVGMAPPQLRGSKSVYAVLD